MPILKDVQQTLEGCQQAHLLKFWDQLNNELQTKLLDQLSTIQLDQVNQLFERAQSSLKDDGGKLDHQMQPVPPAQFESEKGVDAATLAGYRHQGLKEISNNHVAVVLLAGGQGTRLGVSHPKGMYSVELPSGKTLFQIQAERIRRVIYLAQQQTGKTGRICWYIMTSGPTNDLTRKYLAKNNYFGLNKDDVKLFQQGLLPCFDFEGKILLENPHTVAMAPDGNGGIYRALASNGILDDMKARGIKFVHVHSVDNILVKVADPVFIGYCVKKDADCGAKVVRKASPDEPVGVVCRVNGRFQVVEYSEITDATANLRDKSGDLIFSAGNICNHFFTTDFLEKVAKDFEQDLKLHVAKKKIPHADNNGTRVTPSTPNGIKIEKFVFDVFQFTDKFVTWEVPRTREFSALKNANDAKKDCPFTAKRDLLRLHAEYIKNAGGMSSGVDVEISPLLSYAGENLETTVKGKTFNRETLLLADEENETICRNGLMNGKH